MARKKTFFPMLHTHDEYSIKDGCSTVETYAKIVKGLGGDSLAVTNHGQAAGFARQWFACKDQGIKPIFGLEAYLCEDRHSTVRDVLVELRKKDKKAKGKDLSIRAKIAKADAFLKERFRPSPHSVLLAQTREGYRNLVRVSSDSWQRGFYYVPRTDTAFLAEHAEGLAYSTACMGGYIPKLARDDPEKALREARRLQKAFEGRFYVELLMTEYGPQRESNQAMLELAHEIGARTILTCDVHYARPRDSKAQDTLLLMRDKKTIKDRETGGEVWQFETKDLYWKTLERVVECWRDHHGDYLDRKTFKRSVRNTYALAESIEHIEFDTSLKLPGVFENPQATLRELVVVGLRLRVARGEVPASGKTRRDYVDRIKRELTVVNVKGFAEYFLVLHDVCDHARKIGSRMGPGRGSAGGSLLAFLLRITEIDPLRFSLLFERFLDENRPDPPDIDLDFSPEHRDAIKQYVQDQYPATATIGSFGTFKPRTTIQNVARVYGLDHREVLKITKPLGTDADKKTWDEVFDLWPEVEEFADDNPEAWEVIKTLRGLISHRGKNAAGVLIAPASALDEIPMIVEPDTGQVVTAFPDSQGDGVTYHGRELTRLGYLKLDILGVRNLNIAPLAAEILERETGEMVDLSVSSMPLDDAPTLATASTAVVPGVFQLDSATTRPILKHVGVDSFIDLVMVTALCRPGPLKHEIHREFSRLKRAGGEWKRGLHPKLVPLLRESRGLMILQEDVMAVVQVLGGLTFGEANMVRKVIGKKLDPAAFKPWWEKFLEGGLALDHSKEELEGTWSKIVTFARYGFPKAHGVAYMLTSYQQLYMLTHHPLFYFAALLAQTPRSKKTNWGEEKLVGFMRSAMGGSLSVLGPDARAGSIEFDVEDGAIRFGLSKIKGVASAAEAVLAARPFSTLSEFHDKIEKKKANARVVKALIYSGALDGLRLGRGLERAEHEAREQGVFPEEIEWRNVLIAGYHALRKTKGDPDVFLSGSLLDRERELIGFAFSWWGSNQKGELREQEGLETIAWHEEEDVTRTEILAEVTRAKIHKSKRGPMAFLTLADETGLIENVTIFAEQWKHYRDRLKPGRIVVIRLRRRESTNPRYGEFSYYLDDRADEQVEPAQRALRRGR